MSSRSSRPALSPSFWGPSGPASRTLQIMQKLTSLPFQQCKHHISSLDAQPSLSGGVLVFVTGQLLVSGPAGVCNQSKKHGKGWLWWVSVARSSQHAWCPSAPHPPTAARLRPPPPQPEGETNPLKFSQTFHLAPVGGSFVVTNGG